MPLTRGDLPFGEYEQSGAGRAGGPEVRDACTRSNAVVIAP
ncbi:hypothetical protein [Lentzea sp. E54]